jgi:hypothetical protein
MSDPEASVTTSRLLSLTLASVLALGLTACTPSFFAGGGSSAASPSSTPTTGETSPGDEEDVTDEFAGDPASCLLGTWNADNEFFLGLMRRYGDEVTGVTGRVTITFADDGVMTSEYADWRIAATSEGVDVNVVRNGVDSGEFLVSDGFVTLRETHMTSSITVSGGGVNMTVAANPLDYRDVPFTCDSTTAVVTTVDGAMVLHRL